MPKTTTPKLNKPKKSAGDSDLSSFESSLKELQQAVDQIQSGALSLNDSVVKYSAAKQLAKNLESMLESAEDLIKESTEKE